MTEENIYKHLLKQDYDYPKLHLEGASAIASGLVDVIYESLKLKSSGATNKRVNVLKFIQLQAATPENHFSVSEDTCEMFFNYFIDQKNDPRTEEMNEFLAQVKAEVQENDIRLRDELREHCRRRKSLNLRMWKDWDNLVRNDDLDDPTVPSTTEPIIANLVESLAGIEEEITKNNMLSTELREKAVKYGYALVNLQRFERVKPILKKMRTHGPLLTSEKNFLFYLNENLDDSEECMKITTNLVSSFCFIYERIVIKYCTRIIQIETEEGVVEFLKNLESDKTFLNLQKLLDKYQYLDRLIRSIFFELYCYSFCNYSVMRFFRTLFKEYHFETAFPEEYV